MYRARPRLNCLFCGNKNIPPVPDASMRGRREHGFLRKQLRRGATMYIGLRCIFKSAYKPRTRSRGW
ncbi:unnamed protein product, partial [Trichogramma brassicae]